ncbi:MAG: Ig-like domain-containing protein [Cyanobacteria bacterium NC_groundwater_1444_Ag_S-0.65um_54_12]|nr:Ig-like domain-containing protein [Cyanobacteria bacterium NC_groundwater_1444_Ag_S-0.65um_54_12]
MIQASASCPDCQQLFCPSCLGPLGRCLECEAKASYQELPVEERSSHTKRASGSLAATAEESAMASGHPEKPSRYSKHSSGSLSAAKDKPATSFRRMAEQERETSGKPGQQQHYSDTPRYLTATRWAIGIAILAGLGWFAIAQYQTIERARQAQHRPDGKGKLASQLSGATSAVTVEDLMTQLETGEDSPEAAAAADDLLKQIETGQAGDVPPAAPGKAQLRRTETLPEEPRQQTRYTRWQAAQQPYKLAVSIVSPPTGSQVRGITAVTARVMGAVNINRLEFQVNGQWQGLSNHPPFRFEWDTSSQHNGPATLRVIAFDQLGKVHASLPIKVVISN